MFKKEFKNSEKSEKPLLLFVVRDRMYADALAAELPAMILKEYGNVFDCFFSVADETKETKQIFDTKEVHPIMPKLLIIDKHAEKIKLK